MGTYGVGLGAGWQFAGSAVVAAVTGYTMLPIMLPQYTRRFYQKYSKDSNSPVLPDKETLTLVTNVIEKVKLPQNKVEKLDVYIHNDIRPRHHGSFAMTWPSLIGLPCNFLWRTEQDFENAKVEIMQRNFPWHESLAASVKSAIMLTDTEKEFVIAQQLGYIDSRGGWVDLTLKSLFMTAAFVGGHVFNFAGTSKRGRAALGRSYFLSSVIAYVFYLLSSDSYRCYSDKAADQYAATIGPEMCKAGLDYYNKTLEANKALRMLAPGGDKKYTAYGNEVSGVIRTKTLPLVSRRDFLRQIYEKQLAEPKEMDAEANGEGTKAIEGNDKESAHISNMK